MYRQTEWGSTYLMCTELFLVSESMRRFCQQWFPSIADVWHTKVRKLLLITLIIIIYLLLYYYVTTYYSIIMFGIPR